MHRRQCQARRAAERLEGRRHVGMGRHGDHRQGVGGRGLDGVRPSAADQRPLLAGYRRSWLFDPAQIHAAEAAIIEGDTIDCLQGRLRDSGVDQPRPLVLHLLWTGRARTQLTRPLDTDAAIRAAV